MGFHQTRFAQQVQFRTAAAGKTELAPVKDIEQAAKGLCRLGLEAGDISWGDQLRLAAAFAPGSRAEVPIGGRVGAAKKSLA